MANVNTGEQGECLCSPPQPGFAMSGSLPAFFVSTCYIVFILTAFLDSFNSRSTARTSGKDLSSHRGQYPSSFPDLYLFFVSFWWLLGFLVPSSRSCAERPRRTSVQARQST
ncbi:hypothetical protein PILCRDRAFT_813028 [Piloderma croceum F 1598]|uniref:Uncharacterized protein n=1 Tax=Piloderma croceum (strain F 1598) TaxID=765440 RepID=A0A0C3BRM0_PILCF|nr:hypothetical protein PILCRDRAFT_813028 [Piloderma croceum F 1598]